MLPLIPRALTLLVALCAPLVATAAGVSDAPIGLTTPGPLRGLFLDLPLSDARGGAPSLEVRYYLANSWDEQTLLFRGQDQVAVQQDVQADVLQLRLSFPWSRFLASPWARRVETTVDAQVSYLWGGWTDHPIEQWHDLIGSWNFERDLNPRDQVNLTLAEQGGRTLVDQHAARVSFGDVALRTQVRLAEGLAPEGGAPRWAVAARGDLKLPTGRLAAMGGSGGLDGGVGLVGTWAPTSWFTGHGLASLRAVSGLPHDFPLQPRTFQGGLDLSLVFRVHRSVALVGEARWSSPLFESGWSLAPGVKEPEATAWYSLFRPQQQLTGALRLGEVTIFLSEDFTLGKRLATDPGPNWFYDTNTPDVVLGVAWRRQLGP